MAALRSTPSAVAGNLALALLVAAFKAHVLSVLWGWFLVPLGAPSVTLWQAWGVGLVVNLTTHTLARGDVRGEALEQAEEAGRTVTYGIMAAAALGLGWAIHALGAL